MKKKVLMMLATSAITLAACGTSEEEVMVKSEVGNITAKEFNETAKLMVGDKIVQQIMIEKVLDENYGVTKEEIEEEVKKYKEYYGEQFNDFAIQNSGSVEGFEKSLKVSVMMNKAKLDIEISEEELKAYYEQMKVELNARHILVATEEEAKKIKEEIESGADFEKLAKENSIDTGSAESGGNVGWFSVGDMVPEFNDAAYALELNTLSEPIKTSYGYHLIEVLEKKDAEDVPKYKDVKEQIKEEIAMARGNSDAKIVELLKKANIEVKDEDLKDAFTNFAN